MACKKEETKHPRQRKSEERAQYLEYLNVFLSFSQTLLKELLLPGHCDKLCERCEAQSEHGKLESSLHTEENVDKSRGQISECSMFPLLYVHVHTEIK